MAATLYYACDQKLGWIVSNKGCPSNPTEPSLERRKYSRSFFN